MKLPPKEKRFARLLYKLNQVFFPEPFRDCSVLTAEQRIAAHCIRLGRDKAKRTGRPHELLLGEYNAREHLRRENVKRAWDQMSIHIARVHRKPMLPG